MNTHDIAAQSPAARRAFLRRMALRHDGFDPELRNELLEELTPELDDMPVLRRQLWADLLQTVEEFKLLDVKGVPGGFESKAEHEIELENRDRDITTFVTQLVPIPLKRVA